MTDNITVAIPDDVFENNTHTVRVVSNGTRAEEGGVSAAEQLSHYRTNHKSMGYSMAITDATSEDGRRVVDTEFWQNGRVVWHFRTEYFTRVDCARCAYHWAQAYVVIEQDGQTIGKPEPLCGDHIRMTEVRIAHALKAGIELTMHRSEPLHIGQH